MHSEPGASGKQVRLNEVVRMGSRFDGGWFQYKRWKTIEKRCVKIQREERRLGEGLLGYQHGELLEKNFLLLKRPGFGNCAIA